MTTVELNKVEFLCKDLTELQPVITPSEKLYSCFRDQCTICIRRVLNIRNKGNKRRTVTIRLDTYRQNAPYQKLDKN